MQYPQYNPASDNRPLSDEELEDLDDLLAALPTDGAMNIEALDGYLAGLDSLIALWESLDIK